MCETTDLKERKLKAEAEEIEHRTAEAKSLAKWKRIITKIELPTKVVMVLAVIIPLVWQSYNYIAQQKEEHKFEVNQVMLDIVNKLDSDNPHERENAVLLLSSFGEHAIPLLVKCIERPDKFEDMDTIIDSLRLLQVEQKTIVEELIKSGKEAFDTEKGNLRPEKQTDFDKPHQEYALNVIKNYIKVFGGLGKVGKKKEINEKEIGKIISILSDWEEDNELNKAFDGSSIKRRIKESIDNLERLYNLEATDN